MKKQYVLGFLFSPDLQHVVLVRKARPDWQRGLLNGLGGHVKAGETPLEAMAREFQEEAGLRVDDWECVAVLGGKDNAGGELDCPVFRAFGDVRQVRTMTDEPVFCMPVGEVASHPRIPALDYLIPLALSDDAPRCVLIIY